MAKCITNILVIPQSLLLPIMEKHKKGSYHPRFSTLNKYPQPESSSGGFIARLPTYCSIEDDHIKSGFRSHNTMNKQIMDLEQEPTPEALQMKVDTSVEKRVWATGMAKDMTDMNKHLRSRLLDLMQSRLSCELGYSTTEKRRKLGASSSGMSREEHREYLP
ncbi:hypothetical protein IFM89_024179 [Coptis chinensis]|uniref:Uncharacterized protein n=1 Tax=Coptis chinensis TaxID=261450 RepID=A0A835LNA7_9MAGN|nr:hypothetical protein IFM89_024179 [Coptis chinensis]